MTIALHTRLNRIAVPEGQPADLYLLVQLAAPSVPVAGRPPLNLSAVVDRSGSMSGAKIAYTRQALRFLIDQTDGADYLSLVTFDDEVSVLFPAGHVTNKDALKAQVAGIEDRGSTNLSGGMIAGYKEVRRHKARERVNRVLLMTDGQANVGVTDPDALVARVRELNEAGMQLSALGVGQDFAEDLLMAMAEAGGGNFWYIENPDQIPTIFQKELQGLLATAAQGLEVRFDAASGVTVAGVLGYPPSGAPDHVRIAIPDIYGGEVKSLVVHLQVPAAFAGERRLGTVTLAYSEATGGAEVETAREIMLTVTGDSLLLTAPEDPEVTKQVLLARSAEALEQAVRAADKQDFRAGGQALHSVMEPMMAFAEDSDDAEMKARLSELAAQAATMSPDAYDAAARKRMRAQQFQTRSGRR